MATMKTFNVSITVEGDDPEDMAIPRALDMFSEQNDEGITLHWNWDERTA